jgi:hypothetical protein
MLLLAAVAIQAEGDADPLLRTLPTWNDEDAAYRAPARGLSIDAAVIEHIEDGRWSSSALANFGGFSGLSNTGIHEESEADDLWTAYHMWKRLEGIHPNAVWRDRMTNLKNYYINDYVDIISGPGRETDQDYDHLFAWGICDWYKTEGSKEPDGGAAALAAINGVIAAMIDWNASFGTNEPGDRILSDTNGSRRWPRQLRTAVCAAEVSPTATNLAWRDKMIDMVMQAPDFDQRYKMYFYGSGPTTDTWGFDYAGGERIVNTFHTGVWHDALWQTWRVLSAVGDSRAPAVRQRLIDMATYYRDYGPGADGRVPLLTGLNVNTGQRIANTSYGVEDTYTMSPVNGLVFGYKLTGDRSYLDAAWALWLRTQETRWGAGTIGHYADTLLNSGVGFEMLSQNKGELQYVYALFENGGDPVVVAVRPEAPTSLRAE